MKAIINGILRSFSGLALEDFWQFSFILPALNLTYFILENLLKLYAKKFVESYENEQECIIV